ncbi:universal stress protein [Mycobacteroides abscessus]|nr:universal stress protein [Mycobacteroides abscessus]AMU66328.1 universal stress protein [Mycobacteroides abscessus]ANN99739.1 universal stress protein [Mycobacteroides abscessus]ARQ65157.1 universal stress protein [Mycobacteroides abscessus subsp. massiliense]MBL3752749.1 universal stress protein [Mycobacteroides abscessus subsp. massiliense]MBN7318943.1 universal stress protein [Mycobacteroides abscessus subsp. massiliense]
MITGSTASGVAVGVNGTPSSDAAIRWATQEAAMRNEALTLISVFGMQHVHTHDEELREEIYQWRERQAEILLEKALQLAQAVPDAQAKVRTRTHIEYGHPVPGLIEASKNMRMLVVGSRGLHQLDRVFLGSVSTGVLHHARGPVAVIRDGYDVDRGAPVVLGVDGSPASEAAIAIAFDEASQREAPLIAIHAWGVRSFFGPDVDPDALEGEAKEILAERLAGWQERYPDVHVVRRVVGELPDQHLIEASTRAQLVVLGSHGRGGFTGMMLGSVSSAVVHGIDAPAIVVRPS